MLKELLYTSVLVVAANVVATDATCDLQALSVCTTRLTSNIGGTTASTCRAFKDYTDCMLGVDGCDGSAFIDDGVAEILRQQGIDLRALCPGFNFSDLTTTTAATGVQDTTQAAVTHCDTNEMYECSNTVVTAVDGANGDASIICAAAEVYAQCLKKQTCKTSPVFLQALVTVTSRNLDKTCPSVVFTDPTTTTTTRTTTTTTQEATGGTSGTCDVIALLGCTDIISNIADAAQDLAKLCRIVSDYSGCLSAQPSCDTSAQTKYMDDIVKQANMDLNSCPTDSAQTVRSGVTCILVVLLTLLIK